jgi:hypothetical protein
MPTNAITFDDVDAVFSPADIASLLTRLVAGERPEKAAVHARVSLPHRQRSTWKRALRGE